MGGTAAVRLPLEGAALEGTAKHAHVHWPRYSLPGVSGALLFGCLSFTPSLVPRDWVVQGVVNGLSASVGYGAGVFLAWLVRAVTGWTPSWRVRRALWAVVGAVGAPLVAAALWQGQQWQEEIHQLTNVDPPMSYAWVRILVVTLTVLLAIVGIARAFRSLARWLSRHLVRLVPARLAGPLSVLIIVLALLGLNDGLLFRGLMSVANSAFGAANGTTNPGTYQSMAPERSGSPSSLISWESLGRQGRDFVGNGPTVAELGEFSGAPAQRPVRVYAGLRSADSTRARATLAVEDLVRAGGFDRAVLVVATTTGTGLVDPAAAEAIEYMYNGDTAVVGIQYSYLPSWISFLVDHEKTEEAGRELFNQVYAAWESLPRERRPKLLVTGTSMGVFGSEAAFSGEADLRNRVDGAVWAGAPNFGDFREQFVEHRDPGSPEVLPVYDGGRHVRFLARPADARQPATTWERPRVVYVQYGSDAVARWNPALAFTKPDWLSEPRARDVSPDMVWIPVVTFWQVTADLPSTYNVPDGRGHRYSELYVDAWAAVVPPKGWTEADSTRLRAEIRERRIDREELLLGAPR